MCDFIIHQTCASATISDLEKGVGMTVQSSFHDHEPKLYCYHDIERECPVCELVLERKALASKCISQGCRFEIHRSCAQPPTGSVHPSHLLRPLTLCFNPAYEGIKCRYCYEAIWNTFAFSCGECNFYLHAYCARTPSLKHPSHEHHLFYVRETEQDYPRYDEPKHFKCRACLKSCNIDFFWCVQCDFSLHYECSQLQPTVKSEHHIDPLVLCKSVIEDDSGEYYCAICERRRDPNKWVYYCATCELGAHGKLPEVKLEVIEEDDFARRKEDIQKREEEIKLAEEEADAKKASLRPLMARLKSQRAELMELKTDMEVIEEDGFVRVKEDFAATDGELEILGAMLNKLHIEEVKWLIDFMNHKM